MALPRLTDPTTGQQPPPDQLWIQAQRILDQIESVLAPGGGSGLGDPGGNGILVRTALGVTANRSLAEGFGIDITNPTGVSGNPTIAVDQSIAPTWTGNHTFNADIIFGPGDRLMSIPAGLSGVWNTLTIEPTGDLSAFKVNFPNHDNKIVLNEAVISGHWTGQLVLDTQDDIGTGGFKLGTINNVADFSGFEGFLGNLQYSETGFGVVFQIQSGAVIFPRGDVTVGETGSFLGQIKFKGNTSGTVTVQPAAAAGTWTLTLPINDGDSGQALTTNGSGVTSWSTFATQAYADSLVVGLLDDRGNYDASVNTFPASGGSGSAGAILKGDLWTIGPTSAANGTLGGQAVTVGDQVRALTDTPGQTTSNWAISEANIGYVPLNQALADGKIYVGNGSGIGTAVTPSGDVTISNAGVTAIGNLKVINAMIANATIDLTAKVTGILPSANGGTGINNAGRTLTINSNSAILAFASGKTLTVNNSIALSGTDSTVMTFPTTNATIARTDAAQTFTGTQTFSGDVQLSGSTANLFMKDSSTGWQVSSSTVITPQANNSVRTTSFTSGLVGWSINAGGNAEFANVDVRGSIRSAVFLYNALLATSGTLGIFKSAAKLKSDVTITAGPTYGTTTFTIDVVDQDGLTHAASQLFVVNDILRLKDGLVGDTWFKVTAVSDQTTFWRYSASIQAGSNTVTYRAGLAVADYGQSGQGFIILTADQTNAPYEQMATHAGTFSSADASGTLVVTPQLRLGNLNGSYGLATDIYGFGTGQYGTASKSWITVEQTNGIRVGNNITTIWQVDTSGNMILGNVATNQGNAYWDNSTKQLQFRGGTAGTVVHSYIDTTGALVFGGGNGKIDSSGLVLTSNTGSALSSYVKWFNSDFGGHTGLLFNNYSGTGSTRAPSTQLQCVGSGSAGSSTVFLAATNDSITTVSLTLTALGTAFGGGFSDKTEATLGGNNFIGFGVGSLILGYPESMLDVGLTDAATNALTDVYILRHNTSGTAAAGFGTSILFNLESSTGATDRNAARIGTIWTTATDASRTSAFVIQTVNNAGSLAEVARFAGNGDFTLTGVIKAGSGPTTLTDSAGKILSAALNTVAVANGGTGTSTAFTSGSLVFAGASGVYSQDNSNIFWDTTTKRLGVGTPTPANRFHIVADVDGGGVRLTGSQTGPIDPAYTIYDSTTERALFGVDTYTVGGAFSTSAALGDFVIRATTHRMILQSGTGAAALIIATDNGVILGAPTGGSKGAGTLNCAGDVYKNNTAYTNPDFVLEHWATGKIVKYADKDGASDYRGLMPLADVKEFARKHHHLPGFGQNACHGIFSGSDAMLMSLEELYLYVFECEEKIQQLEGQLRSR